LSNRICKSRSLKAKCLVFFFDGERLTVNALTVAHNQPPITKEYFGGRKVLLTFTPLILLERVDCEFGELFWWTGQFEP